MRMTVKTEQLLPDGGAPEYVYYDRTAWPYAVFVGKRYGIKGYLQRNAAHVRQHCLSRQAVHNWAQKFSEVRTSIEDEHRVGRPVEIATPATLQRVEDIRAEWRVTIDAIATAIGCSHKCCLYVIIPIRFFSITICNLLIDFPS